MSTAPTDSASQRVLLIIPCYNEASSVGTLLREIQALNAGYHTIVIDDGSRDETFAVASQLSPCLKLAANLGIGGAVQTGIKYALEHDYDLCIQIDGDGQHPPSQIRSLLESYRASPANLIIGSRFLSESDFKSTHLRRVGIQVIRTVIYWLFGRAITDPTSGLRLMDKKAIRLFSSEYSRDFPEPISIAVALERGLIVREIPVQIRLREHGRSSIAGLKTLAYVLRVVGYLILNRLGRNL